MTKQNMVVPETEAAIDIEHVVSKSAHFTASTLKPPSGRGGGIITISRNKHVKNNSDSNHGARITSWVDSMRASSPTHPDSAAMFLPPTANQHPSALDKFDQIISAAKGKQIVMFLDYDGTLSPIVDDPDRAFMSDAMRGTVRRLAKYFPTAIVSGRCLDKVYGFVKLAELYYAGSHGMDIKGPTKGSKCNKSSVVFQPATEFVPMIDQAYKALVEMTKSIPGAHIEHNKFCVSVHFRCVDEKRWSDIAQGVREVLKDYPGLRLSQGRKVLEIRPTIKWDKGKALEFLLESLGFANCPDVFPIYIGDDRTDEDAFKVIRELGQGIGIMVSKFSKETCASYSLQEPSEVMSFLQRLAGWKRMSSRPKLGFMVKSY